MKKRSKFGWLEGVLGVVLIVLGLYTLFNPEFALSGLVVLFSLLAILSGVSDIVFYIRLKSDTGIGAAVPLVSGILSALAGFMLLLNPVMGKWIFALVFAIWFIAHSISRLANYRRIRALAGRTSANVSLALNILCVLLGIVMLVRPAASAISLGYLVAIALIVHGAGNIAEAFSRMGERDDADDIIWE